MSEFGPGTIPALDAPRKGDVVGIISPHAGLSYSGGVAANAYAALAEDGVPDTVVMIASHGGFDAVYLQTAGSWQTPLGTTEIDTEVAEAISANASTVQPDARAVLSVADNTFELQLLFIQYLSLATKIVPIAAGSRKFAKISSAADELSTALAPYFDPSSEKKVAILASTDLTHYGPQFDLTPKAGRPAEEQNEWIRENDVRVLDMIGRLDETGTDEILAEALAHHNLCCPGAIILGLETMKQLKEKAGFEKLEAKLLKQATSFDVEPRDGGGMFSAVGYGSFAICR